MEQLLSVARDYSAGELDQGTLAEETRSASLRCGSVPRSCSEWFELCRMRITRDKRHHLPCEFRPISPVRLNTTRILKRAPQGT